MRPANCPGFTAGAFSFVLALAFVPGWSEAAEAPRWALLAIAASFVALRPLTAGALPVLLFLAWAALSLIWTASLYDGIGALAKLLMLGSLFMIGASLRSLRPVYVGMALGLGVNSIIVIAQAMGWQGIPQVAPPAGLFANKNYLAEAAVLVLVAIVAVRAWRMVPLLLPAALLPQCRGALAGLGAVAIFALWQRSRALGALALAGLAAIATGLYAAGYGGPGLDERMLIWRGAFDGLTLFGHGLGSFFVGLPSHTLAFNFLQQRPMHAHNDFIEIAYELGGPGLVLYVAALWRSMLHDGPERAVLLAFAIEGCFGFPLHMPVTASLAALAAGHVFRTPDPLRDLADLRRDQLFGGMAAGHELG